MSEQLKKQLTGIATWLAVGALGIIGTFASIIFSDIRDELRRLSEKVDSVTSMFERVDERTLRIKSDIERLDRDKENKK